MYKKLIILLLFIITTIATQASMHVDELPDESYLDLGKKFPSVGYFYREGEEAAICGSGTLINTGIPQLKGRVILTAAHVLYSKEKGTRTFSFCLNGERSSGLVFLHPNYKQLMRIASAHRIASEMYADIAIFLTDKPLKGPSAELVGCDLSYESSLDQYLTTVGYGVTGHVDGVYRIFDDQRRASWSFTSSLSNQYYLHPYEQNYEHTIGDDIKISGKLSAPAKAILVSGPPDEDITLYRPLGVSSKGDSGGGVFNYEGKLIAIVQSGVMHREDNVFLIPYAFYQQSPSGFDKMVSRFEKEDNFRTIFESNIDSYLKDRLQKTFPHERSGIKVFINYHKDWLQKVFTELASTIS